MTTLAAQSNTPIFPRSHWFTAAYNGLVHNDDDPLANETRSDSVLGAPWEQGLPRTDLGSLSALIRLCESLPEEREKLVKALFRPLAITVVETGAEELTDRCEDALRYGLLFAIRQEYPHFPRPEILSSSTGSHRQKRSGAQELQGKAIKALSSQSPVLILTENISQLPENVKLALSLHIKLPPLTRSETVLLYKASRGISLKAVLPKLLQKIPANDVLAKMSFEDLLAALRRPNERQVVRAIRAACDTTQVDASETALQEVKGLEASRWLLEQITEDLQAWKNGTLDWASVTRGALLFGPPGTGKTFCARKLAEASGAHFVTGSYATWQAQGHLGDMLAAMHKTFKEAREHTPSVLFIDEIDSFGDRETAGGDNKNYTHNVINALLESLDGVADNEGVFVIAACNHPNLLDAALIRAGRFDAKIEMPLPNRDALADILQSQLSGQLSEAVSREIALQLVGQSGADVAAIVRQAHSLARRNGENLTETDVRVAVASVCPPVSETDIWRSAVHEAGHIIVGHAVGKPIPIHAQIGNGGGHVQYKQSALYPTRADILSEITCRLGGRAAEEIVLGAPSTGAGGSKESDLAQATLLAASIEVRFGLGGNGLIWQDVTDETLPHLMQNGEVAQRVSGHLNTAMSRAKEIMEAQTERHLRLARALTQRRQMNGSEISDLLSTAKANQKNQWEVTAHPT